MKISIILTLALGAFFTSCTKLSTNAENSSQTSLTAKSTASLSPTEGRLSSSFGLPQNNTLPPSILSFLNGGLPSQFVNITLPQNVTPNSTVLFGAKMMQIDYGMMGIINCPRPKIHPFDCPSCEGSTPRPGCPMMELVYKDLLIDFKMSGKDILLNIHHKDETILFSRTLANKGIRLYQSHGDIKLRITQQDADDYLKNRDKASLRPIVSKFFGFFDIKLNTSN